MMNALMYCGITSKPNLSLAAMHLSASAAQIWSAADFDSHHFASRIMPVMSWRAFARRNQVGKSKNKGRPQKSDTLLPKQTVLDEEDGLLNMLPVSDDSVFEDNKMSSLNGLEAQSSALFPSRGAVLQACTVTSCSIGALGVIIRQISHFLHQEGWPIIDCSAEISFSFEVWHLELIAGLVVLISSCRYLLLKTWPSFSESSEAANRQVLTSLAPLDYMVVAFLPGISEELLFRGALLPVFGIDWKSVLAVATLFGILHLGSGRKYSFAVWATFVGFVYGYATILSSSVIVPMTSHALNNLVGGITWRYTRNSNK